jgi:hypothetical protein
LDWNRFQIFTYLFDLLILKKGVAEQSLKLLNGSVLGKQTSTGINSSYFCQDTAALHLSSNDGKDDVKLCEKIQEGDCVMVIITLLNTFYKTYNSKGSHKL